MTPEPPVPAVAVSPDDQSSDRVQSDQNQTINVEKLDQLIDASTALGNAANTISESTSAELAAATAQRSRFMKVMFAMAVMVVLLLTPILVIVITGLGARNDLKDCVTPGGKCFQEGKNRTGKAVSDITNVAVLAAVCAPDYVQLPIARRQQAIQACIIARLPK